MFPASWPVDEAVTACLQLASVNHGSATWVSPVGHPSTQGLRGFAQSGHPDNVVCHSLALTYPLWVSTHIRLTCNGTFLDIITHLRSPADLQCCRLLVSYII